mmetsp:Transcript_118832/g.336177  ORF Transcript_118832/g.336177 Transcript_118832/m.336177 type:complete len:90 (+) Transcript_118832:1019-1288(+)
MSPPPYARASFRNEEEVRRRLEGNTRLNAPMHQCSEAAQCVDWCIDSFVPALNIELFFQLRRARMNKTTSPKHARIKTTPGVPPKKKKT